LVTNNTDRINARFNYEIYLCTVCTAAIEERLQVPFVTMLGHYLSQCNAKNYLEPLPSWESNRLSHIWY